MKPGVLFRLAAALVVAQSAAACGGTLVAVGTVRADSPLQGADPQPSAVQITPSALWSPRPGSLDATVSYAPAIRAESGAPTLVRHRLAAVAGSGRQAGLHPYGALSLDYGSVRPGDLAAEGTVEPLPRTELLRSYAFRAEGGARGSLTRRTHLDVGMGLDRSAGMGASTATLPELTRSRFHLQAQHRRTRTQEWGADVELSRYVLEDPAYLFALQTRASVQVLPSVSLAATAGGAAAAAGGVTVARPLAGLAVTYEPKARRGPNGRLSLNTRPDFDRQDGGLRQRLLVQGAMDVGPWGAVRTGASVNWASDVGGAGPRRRTLSAEGWVAMAITRDWDATLAAQVFRQGGPLAEGASDPSATRLQFSVSRRLRFR